MTEWSMCRLCWEPVREDALTPDDLCEQCAHPERYRWRLWVGGAVYLAFLVALVLWRMMR